MTGLISLLTLSLFGAIAYADTTQPIDTMDHDVTQGALRVKTEDEIVECPLKHTDVKATISGFIARVTVTQTFHNPFDEKIEAVYVFPLPHTAAVDDMTMVMGERRIIGLIKRRDEARAAYERAIEQGATASLLEQERPNIFTQSVGNIKPGRRYSSRFPMSMFSATTWAPMNFISRWWSAPAIYRALRLPRNPILRRN